VSGRRRVWSELVPYATLGRPEVLRPLRDRGIELLVAVTPETRAGAADVVRACRDGGVGVGLWPMLGDAEGRWPAGGNLSRFRRFATGLLEDLEGGGALPDVVALDLEPPIGEMVRALRGDLSVVRRWVRRRPPHRATSGLARLVEEIHGRGVGTLAAAVPFVLADPPGSLGFQRALDTPVHGIAFESVSPMAYSSLFEGYSRGLVRRRDALALVGLAARVTRRRWGERASLSIGLVGEGVLGGERTLRGVAELAEDVSVARAHGIEDLAVYDLGGMLRRPPIEPWLDALAHTPPAARPPRLTSRAAAIAAVLTVGARVLAVSAFGS